MSADNKLPDPSATGQKADEKKKPWWEEWTKPSVIIPFVGLLLAFILGMLWTINKTSELKEDVKQFEKAKKELEQTKDLIDLSKEADDKKLTAKLRSLLDLDKNGLFQATIDRAADIKNAPAVMSVVAFGHVDLKKTTITCRLVRT